ncbi:MAG TPA: cupin domain-containing protein [Gaiellaceae bacterium]|nr:cupin domain-containing protein [Gaiellaceae bacterium]
MPGVVHRAGEGESLFGGRIVLKATFEELCITESDFRTARPGAEPHYHEHHADAFYVLEGEMAILVHDEEVVVGAGGCVCAPPGVVHGFRTTTPARFLNFHTPDGGFADNLRARDRGEGGGFDSIDAEPGSGLPPDEAVALQPGEGEALPGATLFPTIKVGRDELSIVEFRLEPEFTGPEPHVHEDHVDSFYVIEGETEFVSGDEVLVLGAGSFIAAPPRVRHTFRSLGRRSRVLNVHAPSRGFHDWLRSRN